MANFSILTGFLALVGALAVNSDAVAQVYYGTPGTVYVNPQPQMTVMPGTTGSYVVPSMSGSYYTPGSGTYYSPSTGTYSTPNVTYSNGQVQSSNSYYSPYTGAYGQSNTTRGVFGFGQSSGYQVNPATGASSSDRGINTPFGSYGIQTGPNGIRTDGL